MVAIRPLLTKLGDLLAGEFTLEKRVREGMESLVTELTLMHAALRKVAKVPPEQLDEGVKIWAAKVKELSYQMEDILDAVMLRVEDDGEPANHSKLKKLIKNIIKIFKNGRGLHRISDSLEEVMGQAKQLAEQRKRYEQEMHATSVGVSVDPRVLALYTDVTELVGIEDARDELINMLIGGDDWLKSQLKTISVVGFGGLGKTTLAKVVYDQIKVQFDCVAFVSVSQNPDMKKVFKDILYELDKKKYSSIHSATRDEKQLIDELNEFLKSKKEFLKSNNEFLSNKRYLIVIDDIWDEKVWRFIKCAFPKNGLGSRVITTTRILSVSEACCSSSDDIYKMNSLSDDISRRLFYKRVFSNEKGCPHELLQVSQDILKKCGGIPLSIITIASLLASNRQTKTKEQWHDLLSSIGHGLTEDHKVEEMKKIILLSYYDLPSHLKPCLLYLSIFPENFKILRVDLIWRWIAEGFVHSEKQETSLYELGDSYFSELINRSMMQPIGIDDEERVEACIVHDMVLDLIRTLSSEENLVTILDGTERKRPNSQSKVRRLSIQNGKMDVSTTSMAQVRSLAFFTHGIIDRVQLNICSFQVLRVLDLQGCIISDSGYMRNLLHLRYIRLMHAYVDELPLEIGKLQFLQTLDLRRARGIKELPPSIVRLRHLICLYVHEDINMPSGIGKLMSLEVLDGLMVGQLSSGNFNEDIAKELGQLTKLSVLRFKWRCINDMTNKTLVESLSNLHTIQNLDICADGGRHIDLMREGWVPPPQLHRLQFQGTTCAFRMMPAWINPSRLPLLSYLEIWVEEVRPDDIRLLGLLPTLRSLSLIRNTIFSGGPAVEMSIVTADAFPCATECRFIGIAAVPSIFPEGAMPRVKFLRFGFPAVWISLGDFDFGMGHLPSLKYVQVELLCEKATDVELEEAEAAVRAAVEEHPNGMHLNLSSW